MTLITTIRDGSHYSNRVTNLSKIGTWQRGQVRTIGLTF